MKCVLIIAVSIISCFNAIGMIPQEVKYWEFNKGERIAYFHFEGKKPAKPTPIIYLHGGPGGFVTSRDTAVFSKLSDDGYDVYLYDQIGSGRSSRLKNIRKYSVKRHLRDLEAIVQIIGAPKVILIGHSWGASLAPLYVAKHPDKVEKMVFSGPGGMIPKNYNFRTPLPDSIKLKRPENVKYSSAEFLEPAQLKRFNRICTYAYFGIKVASDYEIDSLLDCLMLNQSRKKAILSGTSGTIDYEGGSGGYSNIMTGRYITKGKDPRRILGKCTIPVLILLGENDGIQWANIADYLKTFRDINLIIIPDSGHSVFSFQPKLCLDITRKFLIDPE
jgi:proline iminopeptidase